METVTKPILFIFSGLPASGKTTLAKLLAKKYKAACLRIDTIEQAIRDLPIFNLFDYLEQAIEFMTENGTIFNKFTDKSLLPLSFMIFHAGKEDAEAFFNNYVSSYSYKKRIISLYRELEKVENIDLNHSEFVYTDQVKLAFINGLETHTISTEDKYDKLKNE